MTDKTPPRAAERRAQPRDVVDLPAVITLNGRKIGCTLIDVSHSGALVAAPVKIGVGDQVRLKLHDAAEVVGTVVRTTPSTFALVFAGVAILSVAGG
jgi:protein involved in polysaccharide export with SLBB domain